MSKVIVDKVSKNYGTLNVLADLDLKVETGEFLVIVGKSGCGKSTLLKIMAGLEKPTKGKVIINDKIVAKSDPRYLMVLQDPALYPWRTIEDNIGLGPELQKWPRQSRLEKVEQIINTVGLTGFNSYYSYQVSGGMCQRVSLARAFIMEPEILFLDEPFAALDPFTKWELQDELLRLWSNTKSSVILITHDIEEAIILGDRILVMNTKGGFSEEYKIDLPRPRRNNISEIIKLREAILKSLGEVC